MKTKNIEIDTEANFLIESLRIDFSETPNEIIKRALKSVKMEDTPMQITGDIADGLHLHAKRHRVSGHYGFNLFDEEYTEFSLKHAYIACLRALQARDSGFFARLAVEETRARRLVAEKPEKLYKNSPELAAQHAEKIDGHWYLDVNLSEPQVIQRLKIACRVARIEFGRDLKLDFHL